MNQIISDPLPWYIAGPLLGLFVPVMVLLTGKEPRVSGSFDQICSILPGAHRFQHYKENPFRLGFWQVLFVAGILLGGTLAQLAFGGAGIPLVLPENLSAGGLIALFIGGVLVGFGTRWANGCTSGHTISGISNLSVASMIASACFIIGGTLASLVHRFMFGGLVP